MDDFVIAWILGATVAAFLGLIPASIAQKKGYNFGLWWLYGWALFIIAIVHVSLIPEKGKECSNVQQPLNKASESESSSCAVELNKIEELKQYKNLMDEGILTTEEFEMKKRQLLGL